MIEFAKYLRKKVFSEPCNLFLDKEILDHALDRTIADVRYHFPGMKENEIISKIENNDNELIIFLYRMATQIAAVDIASRSLKSIHFLMRHLCSCEIYYTSKIDVGFYVIHGLGTVIGSRHIIGKGFQIYQNCTIGHMRHFAAGMHIGNDVTVCAGAKVFGELEIGDGVLIGANAVVTKSIKSGMTVLPNNQLLDSKLDRD